jgi:hypothetical protein
LNAAAAGTGVLRISAPGIKAIKVNDIDYPAAPGKSQLLVAKFQAGGNPIAVQYESEANAAPLLDLETAIAPIFIEAEEGQLTPPMQKMARTDAVGGAIILVPAGSGRGEKDGKATDNGYATYKISVPKDGKYRLQARVFWKNTSNNSLFHAWDGGEPKMLGNDENYDKWHWVPTESTALTAGEHTLVIRNRDENSVLDCMVLVPESSDSK